MNPVKVDQMVLKPLKSAKNQRFENSLKKFLKVLGHT